MLKSYRKSYTRSIFVTFLLPNRRSTYIARKRLSDGALCGYLEAASASDSSNGLHAQTRNHLIRAYIASKQ